MKYQLMENQGKKSKMKNLGKMSISGCKRTPRKSVRKDCAGKRSMTRESIVKLRSGGKSSISGKKSLGKYSAHKSMNISKF